MVWATPIAAQQVATVCSTMNHCWWIMYATYVYLDLVPTNIMCGLMALLGSHLHPWLLVLQNHAMP